MSFESDLERYTESLRDRALRAMEEVCGIVEDEIAEKLNVAYPPASAPGDNPARRTGNLRAGLFHYVGVSGEAITGTVASSRNSGNPMVPLILDSTLRRPYITNTDLEWRERFRPEILGRMQV